MTAPDPLSLALADLLTEHGRWAGRMTATPVGGGFHVLTDDEAAQINAGCVVSGFGCDYTDPATWWPLLTWLWETEQAWPKYAPRSVDTGLHIAYALLAAHGREAPE